MNEKRTIFFPVEKDGRVRQVVNGIVQSLSKKTFLANNPSGWNEIVLFWERVMTRYGMQKPYSLPLKFPMDGMKILRNDYYKFNIDRELFFIAKRFVSEIDDDFYKEYYKHFYKAEFDFSTFKDIRKEKMVEITLMEGGNAKLLKAAEGTKKDYFFDNDHIIIHCTGIDLYKNAKFVLLDGFDIKNVDFSSFLAPLAFVNSEGESFGIAFTSENIQDTTGLTWAAMLALPNWCAQNAANNTNTVNVRITGKIIYQCTRQTTDHGLRIRFARSNQLAGNQNDYQLFYDVNLNQGQIYSHNIDITIPLQPGERLYMDCFLGGPSVDTWVQFLPGSELKMEFKNKYKDTFVKGFRPYDLYKKICLAANIPDNKIVSELLQSCSFYLTCGDSLRGIDGAAIKTMFNDFWKAYDVYLMAGQSIENQKIIFEDRRRFFDPVDPIQLGEVVLREVNHINEMMFSSIKIGHAEQDIDDVNGKFDFNGVQIWNTPVKRVGDHQLDLQSPYSAGPYEIEKNRINYDGKTTTDANGDNKIFVIAVDTATSIHSLNILLQFIAAGNVIIAPAGTVFAPSQRLLIAGSANNNYTFTVLSVTKLPLTAQQKIIVAEIVTDEAAINVNLEFVTGQVYEYDRSPVVTAGVPSFDTIFNVPLQVKRLLNKHLPWINGFLHKYDTGKLVLESPNRNKDLVADGIIDKADVLVATMPARMYLPVEFLIYTMTQIDLPEKMDLYPNKAFSFVSDNVEYVGFNLLAGCAITDMKPQEFKLLSAPANDLKTLIL